MAWGPLERLKDVVGGLGGAAQAPFGFAWDLARAATVGDDRYDGILGTLNAAWVSRWGQFTERAFGPETGLGAVAGGLPTGGINPLESPGNILNIPRAGGGDVLGGAAQGLETIGEFGIRRPITTLSLQGGLAESPEFQGEDPGFFEQYGNLAQGLVDPETWRTAWNMSEDISPGQSAAIAFGDVDVADEDQVARFLATDAAETSSGLVDGLVRLFLEPDFLVARGGQAFRQGARRAEGTLTPGTLFEAVPPQIGGRSQRVRETPRIRRINDAIDQQVSRLPGPVRSLIESEKAFDPADVERLERLDATREEILTGQLEDRARRARDPVEVSALGNIAESRRTREARRATGAAPTQARLRVGEQAQRDITTYFSTPPHRGVVTGLLKRPGWQQVNRFIDSLPTDVDTRAGMIRDRLFPTHHRGDLIGRYLAEAGSLAEREAIMRVFLGDMRGIADLDRSNHALAMRLQDLQTEQAVIRTQPAMTLVPPKHSLTEGQLSLIDAPGMSDLVTNNRERLARIREEIDAVESEGARNEDLLNAQKSVPAGPTVTGGQQLRHVIRSSRLWQTSAFARPVRTIFDMRPHHIVGAADSQADAQLGRMMRQAGYGDDEIHAARGEFFSVPMEQRGLAFQNRVEQAERQVLKDAGLDADEMDMVIREARLRRGEAEGLVRGSRYDGEGRARLQLPEGGEFIDMPLFVTQLQDSVVVPNFRRLRRESERYARLKYGDDWRSRVTRGTKPAWKAKEHGQEGLRSLMDVWKTGVLLRPAWTIRVVGDEQLRMIAKFGALSVALGARRNLNNYMARLKRNPIVRRVLGTDDVAKGGRRGAMAGAVAGMGAAGPTGAAAGGALGNRLVRKVAQSEMAGITNVKIGGMTLSGPYGNPGTKAEIYRSLVSARGAVNDIFGTHENRMFGALRRDANSWRTHVWGQSDELDQVYRQEWANQMRKQLAQDEMAKQFLGGKNADEVLDWMDNTLEGRRYAAMVPYRSDHRAWVDAAADQVQAYTGGSTEVQRRILDMSDQASPERWKELLDLIPEDARRPIHGAELAQVTARGPIQGAITGFVDNSFEALGSIPTDELSRSPTFEMFYLSELRRLTGDAVPGRVHTSQLERWEGQARDFALRETRELLYDLAERSEFGEMVRTLIPFYPAWQEVLTRWSGLVAGNPAIVPRARAIWQAPDKLGWTYTDDQGETFIRIKIPEFAKGLVNQGLLPGALDSQGYIYFDKNGFNLAAEGTPGAGPIVQFAVSEMVRANPSLENSVEFILPFGPSDAKQTFIPPLARRIMDAQRGEDGAARANARGRLIQTALVDMQLGERPMVDFSDPLASQKFLEEVETELDAFMRLRAFAGYISPVSPLYESPYQPYIEVYRALRDGNYQRANEVATEFGLPAEDLPSPDAPVDPQAADDLFLEAFGPEYFALTQSFTESLNGIPPTLESLEAGEEFGDLITRYPEWGGVIAGYDGGGAAAQFSRAVYDRQLARGERRRLEPDEIAEGPDIRLGWINYSKTMDQLEMIRVERGLPNMQVKEAEDLRIAKQVLISRLAGQHPAWWREFNQQDRLAAERKIEGARALVANDKLAQRPDIQGLADYLTIRDAFQIALTELDLVGLDTEEAQDLANQWDTLVAGLVERNPAFGDLWYRKLEQDRPEGISQTTQILESV